MRAKLDLPNGYAPTFFCTGTSRRRMGKDELEIAVQKYVRWVSRNSGHHLIVLAGIEWGDNSHFHIVFYLKGFINDRERLLFQIDAMERKNWGYGRIECTDFNSERYADFYTAAHHTMPFGNEVFCPCKKRACRKNRCPEQVGMSF